MDKDEFIEVLKEFAKNNDFKLNPDAKHVDLIVSRTLLNQDKFGLKLCPCRIRDGTFETDLKLICPCNFKIQPEWTQKGMCHCGLFVKK